VAPKLNCGGGPCWLDDDAPGQAHFTIIVLLSLLTMSQAGQYCSPIQAPDKFRSPRADISEPVVAGCPAPPPRNRTPEARARGANTDQNCSFGKGEQFCSVTVIDGVYVRQLASVGAAKKTATYRILRFPQWQPSAVGRHDTHSKNRATFGSGTVSARVRCCARCAQRTSL
jgi:hypothetical protein